MDWHTSSYSAGNGNCVQVATLDEALVAVQDSKNPGVVLAFTPDAWRELVRRVRDGDG